jgi:hypothetical protein
MDIACDPETVRIMKSRIDATDFRTVKAYFRDPKSEIEGVVLVQGEHRLEEVAAFFAAPDPETVEERFLELLRQGAIVLGVDDFRGARPALDRYAVLLDTILDDRTCHVVYLPPLYIVRVTDMKWE